MDDEHTHFSEEALKSQDGKTVPLRAFPGGPVIGEATLQYHPESKSLGAKMSIDDPAIAQILGDNPSAIILQQGSSIIFRQGE